MQMQPFESSKQDLDPNIFGDFSQLEESPIKENAYEFARLFECQLKQAVVNEATRRNQLNDGNMQDGFSLAFIEDGWVSYKGTSFGFVVHTDPIAVDMTFNPDCAGSRMVLQPQTRGGKVIWTERNTPSIGTVCLSADEVAHFALNKLTQCAERTS